jgi:hypothetical protein
MTALVEFLEAAHYRRVPLRRNGVGHFEAEGTLNERPVRVLIDTGAARTVVSLALARELALTLQPLERRGGGAGGANLALFDVQGAALLVEGAVPRIQTLIAMDLAHVNTALTRRGATAVDVVLGVDVFDAQAAVIDYGSASLFLREVS